MSRKPISLDKDGDIRKSYIGYDEDGCRVAYPDTLYSEEIYPKRNDTGLFKRDLSKVSLEKYYDDEDDEYEDEDEETSLSLLGILRDLYSSSGIIGRVLCFVFTVFLALFLVAQMPNIIAWIVRFVQDGGWL